MFLMFNNHVLMIIMQLFIVLNKKKCLNKNKQNLDAKQEKKCVKILMTLGN